MKFLRYLVRKFNLFLKNTKYSLNYPVSIKLNTTKGSLKFQAFSPVESYRIADYGDEKFFVEKFTQLIVNDDIVFDIGASVGLITLHSALFAKLGKVYSFEPDPDTMYRLKHNVSLNDFSNVVLVPKAVSDFVGVVSLFTDGSSGKAPTMREQINRKGSPKTIITVPTTTLDSEILAGNLPLPTILKIDIEGAEYLCLNGSQMLLSGKLGNKPRLIFMELHPEFLPSFGTTWEVVHNFVLNQGYSIIWEQKRDNQIHYCYKPI